MEVAIAGGHGKIALLLGGLLAERGHTVFGLIRDPAQEDDLHAVGVEPVICDLERDDDVAEAVSGAEAVVFAAGAGPGSGAERKRTMDLGGAVKLIDAAKAEGIDRYVMVSAMGAADPPAEGGEVYGEYLRAKAGADRALAASGLAYTIVRPGGLTDEAPSGLVRIGERLERGQIPRADVAAVLAAVLEAGNAVGKTFDLVSGETPVAQAVSGL
ncbi:MAG: NAD(P)H-binding protein [Solirubrobacterales bacterium]